MSFERPRPATVSLDQPLPAGQRRTFLDVLRLELQEAYEIGSDVVRRDGQLVLFAVTFRPTAKSADIGCDMLDDGWWFTWAAEDDRTIAPVEGTPGTAAVIAGGLGVCARNGRHADRS